MALFPKVWVLMVLICQVMAGESNRKPAEGISDYVQHFCSIQGETPFQLHGEEDLPRRHYECYQISVSGEPCQDPTGYWIVFAMDCLEGYVYDLSVGEPESYCRLGNETATTITTEPTTTDATTTEPTTTEPTTTEPTTTEPTTTEPTTTEPTTAEPITTEPTTTELTTTEPTTTEPTTTEPTTTEPTTTEPTTTEPTTTEPTTTEPTTTNAPTTEFICICPEPSTTIAPSTWVPTTEQTSTTEVTTTEIIPVTTETSTIPTSIPTTVYSTNLPSSSPLPDNTTVVPPISTTGGSGPYICIRNGVFPDPSNPFKYFRCVIISGSFFYYVYTCPPTACYNADRELCIMDSCPEAALPTTLAPAPTVAPSTATTVALTTTLADIATTPTVVQTTKSDLTTVPTTVSTTLPTTSAAQDFICKANGLFANPNNCTAYYRCSNASGVWIYYSFSCPFGTHWSQASPDPGCLPGPCP